MKFKKIIRPILVISIVGLALLYHQEISRFIIKTIIYRNNEVAPLKTNQYSQKKDYAFVQITNQFTAKNYQDLLNIFYTILDSGESSYSFYCDFQYKDCAKDIDKLIPRCEDATCQQESALADLNNFIHPYNTYNKIDVAMNNYGKITVIIEKQYSEQKIRKINEFIEEVRLELEQKELPLVEQIKSFHDYIVGYTTYDSARANNMNDPMFDDSTTHTAYGLIEEKKALCGGYSDMMSIYLYQLHLPNIRIAADNHVWNLVYIDNAWKHLDVTWDDPVTNTGEPLLIHDYFLIPYDNLIKTDPVEHQFNEEIYQEGK